MQMDPVALLPAHLAERTRVVSDTRRGRSGSFILYWMHHAVRGHENPALNTAVWLGNEWGLPVLVYQGLGGRHRYNSDRHHTFIMEGARDVQRELSDRGVAYAFHLARKPQTAGPLRTLAEEAALVITEDFPAPPFPRWIRSLSDSAGAGVWAVNAHCIVPMQCLGKPFARAFQFRDETKEEFARRVSREWSEVAPELGAFDGDLGFEQINFDGLSIADIVAECDIDHSVGPVPHTPGGSVAGYHRWKQFRKHGLKAYARLRNDAAVVPPKGVSRLSPYLHHGHVSPFRIAREASADDSDGARKFLDELLIWRELAHNFCFYNGSIESLDALPEWARQTLADHASDERDAVYSWERLARGETGDELWDAAQKSLLIHGELHNNVRMTWGKALLRWTSGPEETLRLMIDLNHRYALDGCDPNSYGGLLWCLGLFDRPFTPELPIYGNVRPRSTEQHVRRLDMAAYTARVTRPARSDNPSVAVIGAGVAGLTAARTLADHGLNVHVFDKGRSSGGRISTRRTGDVSFDHGAQYVTARDERFARYVDSWMQDGLVQPWKGLIGVAKNGQVHAKDTETIRFVGVPGMSTLAEHLSRRLNVTQKTRVDKVDRIEDRWHLSDDSGSDLGQYDVLLVATPPIQAVPFLKSAPSLADKVAAVNMEPCWAVMVAFDKPLDLPYDGVFLHDSPLSWAARNSSKPGRGSAECWVLHGSPAWSRASIESDESRVVDDLLAALYETTGIRTVEPESARAHRWRYALAENPLDVGCLWDGDLQLGVCGDWCAGSRVEGAFLSGMAAAGRVLGMPDPRRALGPAEQLELI